MILYNHELYPGVSVHGTLVMICAPQISIWQFKNGKYQGIQTDYSNMLVYSAIYVHDLLQGIHNI